MRSGKKSKPASDGREESYVYDFLYYDARRIGSFQAQLGHYGAPLNIKHHQGSEEGSVSKEVGKVGGGVPGVTSGEAGVENQVTTNVNESLDREFDPFWTNGLSLFEELDSFDIIKRDVDGARIGQFVLVQGALAVVDFGMFKTLWGRPSIQAMIQQGVDGANTPTPTSRAERRRDHRGNDSGARPTSASDVIGDILAAIPHPVQARMLTERRQSIWASLKTESLVIDSSDVFLKHGIALEGRWNIFGVLDALPVSGSDDPLKDELVADFESLPFGQMAVGMLPLLQSGYARTPTAYGVTPIMIFREVTGG